MGSAIRGGQLGLVIHARQSAARASGGALDLDGWESESSARHQALATRQLLESRTGRAPVA